MSGKSAFFLKLGIIAVILTLADAGAGRILQHFYFRIPHGEQARLTFAADSSQQDILVLGSSRASHHYVSTILSSQLGYSCYNAGKDKQGILYSEAILKMVLSRHRPAYVILDISPSTFSLADNGMDLLSVLLPYYDKHPEIRTIVNNRSRWEPLKTTSFLYCYNSLLLQIIFNNLSGGRDADAVDGYVPLNRNFSESIDSVTLLNGAAGKADSILVNAFLETVQLCNANGCKLVVVVSPFYLTIQQPSPTLEKLSEICQQKKIAFLDYHTSAIFTENKQVFSDPLHLNHTGATLFSSVFCAAVLTKGFIKNPSFPGPH